MATIDLKLKSYDELQFEIMRLNTDNYLKQQQIDQLTNNWNELKQENEKLRKNQRFHKKFGDDYIFCLEGDKETYKDMIFMYQERIDKAIEYIKNNWITYEDSKQFTTFDESLPVFIKEINDLLNILQNGSEDNE